MRSRSRPLVFAYITMFAFSGAAIGVDPPIDVKNVQQVREACLIACLNNEKMINNVHYLIRMGEKVFPA